MEEYVSVLEKAAMPVDVDAYESEIQQLKEALSNEKNKVDAYIIDISYINYSFYSEYT